MRRVWWGLVVAVLLGVAWIERYHYTTMHLEGRTLPVRVNRFTDRTQVFFLEGGGWYDMERPAPPSPRQPVAATPADTTPDQKIAQALCRADVVSVLGYAPEWCQRQPAHVPGP